MASIHSNSNHSSFRGSLHTASPDPEGSTNSASSTPAPRYRHDPYGVSPSNDARVVTDSPQAEPTPNNTTAAVEAPPAGTLHTALWGQVSFLPYPDEEFVAPAEARETDGELVRVFVGQLPYFVADMQLEWLCYTFGNGHVVSYPERIMKRQANGERLPTGCVHAYCTQRAVAEMADGMHKRMLIDDTGVWHAQSQPEFDVLSEYVAAMKRDKTKRFPNRPYDTVVVQFATSTYVPRHVAATPHLTNAISTAADVIPDKLRRGSDAASAAGRGSPQPQPHLGAVAGHVMTKHGYTPKPAPSEEWKLRHAPAGGAYGYQAPQHNHAATAAAAMAQQQPPSVMAKRRQYAAMQQQQQQQQYEYHYGGEQPQQQQQQYHQHHQPQEQPMMAPPMQQPQYPAYGGDHGGAYGAAPHPYHQPQPQPTQGYGQAW